MRVLVIGAAGQIGAYTVRDLVEFYKADVVAADRNLENARKVMADVLPGYEVETQQVDANNSAELARFARATQIETVINCAWYQTNLAVMDACLRAGAHYVDLGGLFDTTLKQLSHHEEWEKAGLNATIGLGSTPGLTNLASAAGSVKLDTVDTIDIYCSWGNTLSNQPGWPSYSIRTALDEFSQEPVMWLDGKYSKQPLFSGERTIMMRPPVGQVTTYYVKHSEPATLGRYVGKGCQNVTFRIGFPQTDLGTLRTLTSLGFASQEPIQIGTSQVSPLDFLTAMYRAAVEKSRRTPPPNQEYEYDAFKIDVHGALRQAPATRTYNIITWNDPEKGIPSSRDTSVPPSIAAYWQETGRIKKPGVFPPEATIEPEPFFAELGKRKIMVEEEQPGHGGG